MTLTASYNAVFSLPEILSAVDGELVTLKNDQCFQPTGAMISTDSRSIAPGDFFVPLSGPSFDGHHFLKTVFEMGASGAFVAKDIWMQNQPDWQLLPNLIAVSDTQRAYQQLATFHRFRVNPKVVGITGSSGKTTIKELLYAALCQQVKTQKTEKNFNNEIGVPKTLLALEPDTQVSIVEMAMRGLDQIRPLSLCAKPDVAIINNIGPAHIGLLGTLENVAQAKLEIAEGLDVESGQLLVNADDALLLRTAQEKVRTLWGETALDRLLTYSLSEAGHIQSTPSGSMTFEYQGQLVTVNQPGLHMVSNTLAVLKMATLLGYPLKQTIEGIASYVPVSGRWDKQALPAYQNAWVIDDAYNANPSSFKASLEAFLSMPKASGISSVLILGGMKELGDESEQYHLQLGCWLKDWLTSHPHQVKAIITVAEDGALLVRELAKNNILPVYTVNTVEAVMDVFSQGHISIDHTLFFIKGSRSVGLDQVAGLLKGGA